MDVPPLVLLKLLLPRVPSFLSTWVLNKLSLSANSDKQDAQTEVTVLVIRSVIGKPKPLNRIQATSLKRPPVKGNMWISMATAPAPDSHVRDMVLRGIKELGNGKEDFILPDIGDVEAEWTGWRNVANKKTPRPELTEKEHYINLMKETTSDVTILYFHGGAYMMMDPATHRLTTANLAKRTGGRCFSVRYRLAPQNPFPAALLDAFVAYLYLLSPPEGSFHEPVKASNIVFSGDSAGGNLSVVLGLLLLTLKRAGVESVPFHGKDVPIELPAGLALTSPWADISRCLPSVHNNAKYDYLDPPSATGMADIPDDEIWPASPPRAEIYCQASILLHPLASPVMASPEMWKGLPPVFICGGTEGLEDEFTLMARRMYQSGTSVDFVIYSGMPHCFAMIFPTAAVGKDCFSRLANFCVQATEGKVQKKDVGLRSKVFSQPLAFDEVRLAEMGVSDDEALVKLQEAKDLATQREMDEVEKWQRSSKARL